MASRAPWLLFPALLTAAADPAWWALILRNATEISLYGRGLSGHLPADIGERWPLLTQIFLSGNNLTGPIPPGLGGLSRLKVLSLSRNRLTGPIPAELGRLRLQSLSLGSNRLSGPIPAELGRLPLQRLFLENNELTGAIPAELGNFYKYGTVHLGGNRLEGTLPESFFGKQLYGLFLGGNPGLCAGLGDLSGLNVEQLEINNCGLRSFPRLPWGLRELQVRGNELNGTNMSWRGLPARLAALDVSENPLKMPVDGFVAEVARLRLLNSLKASDSGLTGALRSSPQVQRLNLSGNEISAVQVRPSPRLQHADFSRNAIVEMEDQRWWQGNAALRWLDVRDNEGLRLPLLKPPGRCSGSEFRVNGQAWNAVNGSMAECTSFCRDLRPLHFRLDGSVEESVLCRCTEGQGAATSCAACPDHSYSVEALQQGRYVRSCRSCPAFSELPGGVGECFADCSCRPGYYMAQVSNGSAREVGASPCGALEVLGGEGECRPCGKFKSSAAGSRAAAACFCDGGGWAGLLEQQGSCRCGAGEHMSFAQRRCVPCRAAEDCSDWLLSLRPPRVKPGFWALPPPPEGADGSFGNFSRHDLWRCDSAAACPGNFSCGWNRSGLACSLCVQGHFRSPSGACLPCPMAATATRLALLAGLLAAVPVPLAANAVLCADANSRGLILTLRSFRTSLRQVAKFAQVMAVVAVFQVQWPPLVASVFDTLRALSLDFASWSGVACLDAAQQQTLATELLFRWALPLFAAAVTSLSAVVAAASRRLTGRSPRLQRFFAMRRREVLRVLFFFLQLFYPSLLKSALLPITCSPSPNGRLTMNAFPHVVCWSRESEGGYWALAALSLTYSLLLLLAYPLVLHLARRRTDSKKSRSWWAFAFDDFRPKQRAWALVAVAKDIALNLVPILLPGLGTAQLLVTAAVTSAYAVQTCRSSPFCDVSNTALEACTSTAVAVLCVFSAGMGFQSEPELLDISDHLLGGDRSPLYLQRAVALAALQGLSLLAPFCILGHQLLVAFERTRRCVPRRLRPFTEEERQAMRTAVRGGLVLEELDAVEFAAVWSIVSASRAAPKVLAPKAWAGEEELQGELELNEVEWSL